MAILVAKDLGTLHIIPADSRTGVRDLNDASVTSTFETCDLSHLVPNGTKAVWGFACASIGSNGVLVCREVGSTTISTGLSIWIKRVGSGWLGEDVTIYAPEGIFQYAEYSAAYPVTSFEFMLKGYYI